MLPLPELHRDRQPGRRTGNGYLPYGLSSQMGLVRQRQGVPYQSLHTAPSPAATSAAGAPYGKRLSAVRLSSQNGFGTAKAGFAVPISPHSPEPSSHFRSPGPNSHFLSTGPQCQSHAVQKTGPILYRRLLQTDYRTLSVPQ